MTFVCVLMGFSIGLQLFTLLYMIKVYSLRAQDRLLIDQLISLRNVIDGLKDGNGSQ